MYQTGLFPSAKKIKLSKINYKSDEKVFVFAIWQWENKLTTISQFSVKLELLFCWLQIILNTE